MKNKFTPSTKMQKAALEGLSLYSQSNTDNINALDTNLPLVKTTAKLSPLSLEQVYTIKDWHDNHSYNSSENDLEYLLHLGEAGKEWSNKIVDHLNKSKQSLSMTKDCKGELILLSTNAIRVPLAEKGIWHHDSYGIVEFNDQDFNDAISNYKNNKLGFEPYITYGHIDEEPNSTDAQRKKGSLIDILVEDDVLYGDFSVKEDTYNLVKEGEYEYSSGEFIRNFLDKDKGERIGTTFLRVALTNAPFIPFKEKVQALTQTTTSNSRSESTDNNESNNNCSQNILPFVIELSINKDPNINISTNNTDINPDINISDKNSRLDTDTKIDKSIDTNIDINKMQVEQSEIKPMVSVDGDGITATEITKIETEQVKPLETTTIAPEVLDKAKVEETKITEQVLEEINKNKTTEKNFYMENFKQLAEQIDSLKTSYQEKLEQSQKLINDLTLQVSTLTNKLTNQEAVTQAFSQNMSKAQEQALYKQMSDKGVVPTVIQRFSTLKSALESAQVSNTVVKLSTSVEGEVEESKLIDAVAALLIDATNKEPVAYQQFGMNANKSSRGEYYNEIINRNKELASKRQLR